MDIGITELPKFVVLCGIGYNTSVHEGLVVFEQSHCMYDHHTRMVFERVIEPGGCWYLSYSSTYDSLMVSHIVAAYELLCDIYGKNFEEKKPL